MIIEILIRIFIIGWPICGVIGYILRLLPKQTRPAKPNLWIMAFIIHTIMGYISLLYGYVCYASRNNSISER